MDQTPYHVVFKNHIGGDPETIQQLKELQSLQLYYKSNKAYSKRAREWERVRVP